MGGISKEGMGGNTVGGYFAYADGRNKLEDLNTRVKTDSYNGGVFGILRGANNVSLTADFAYGYYTNEAARENLAGRFVGDMNQNVFGTGLMLRRDFIRDNKILTPLVGARYQYLTQGRYDEEAEYGLSEFANSLDKFNANSLQSYVGATWSAGTQTAQGRIVNPMVYAVWRHEFMDKSYSTLGSYAGDIGQTFVINSIARERDLADLGGSLSVTNNCTTVGLGYNATLTKGYTEHNWYAGMSYRF